MDVHFGREITGNLAIAEKKEWLITNGIGGYGSGTVAGSLTRGYHGLLVAALRPPIDRRILLVKLEETLTYRGQSFALTTNRWKSGAVAPAGYLQLQRFELQGAAPCWYYACSDALIEKRIWMEHGANTTYVSYRVVAADEPVTITAAAIVDNRVFHNKGQVAWPVNVQTLDNGVQVSTNNPTDSPLYLRMDNAQVTVANELYQHFYLPAETARGLNDDDSHVHAAIFEHTLAPGETLLFVASTEEQATADPQAWSRESARQQQLLATWNGVRPKSSAFAVPSWLQQLVMAADQFVVDRPSTAEENGKSIIAGYHWFEDWGRDTMISLPGLTLATGRPEIAATILQTFARYIDQGMLPNRFPDATDTPEYNTIDATLWYFQAIRSYFEKTRDKAVLAGLYPKLAKIIDWHVKGTRYNIKVDPSDHLLYGGQEGVQLTWMDAKVGDQVITPRIGKPVEVNALWYNALTAMVQFAQALGKPSTDYQNMADATLADFARFWNEDTGYCYDVLDGPNGHETLLRPNQLFAVALPDSPLNADQQKKVVDTSGQALLASYGLRSLDPTAADYIGYYGGDQYHRDSAYHQGTVWGWLVGPYVKAHWTVYRDAAAAERILAPFADHIMDVGLGTISEIFTGDTPFVPKGCVAQAWSVGQVLECYNLLEREVQ